MKKSIIISISCILLISIITIVLFYTICDGNTSTVKETNEETSQQTPGISNEIHREMLLWKDGDILYYTNPNFYTKAFSYNTATGELKEHTSDTAYKNIKYEDDTYLFINNWEGFYFLDKKSGEKHYIYNLKYEQENDGFEERYGISGVEIALSHCYNGKLYFHQTVFNNVIENESKLFSFDFTTKEKKEFLANENITDIVASENKIYYISAEENTKSIKCYNLDTGDISTVIKALDQSITNLHTFNNGIYYIAKDQNKNTTLNTYNFSTKKTKSTKLPTNLLTPKILYSEINDEFFIKLFDETHSFLILNNNLEVKTNVKKLPVANLTLTIEGLADSIVEINGKYYYGVFYKLNKDSSFAVYSIDWKGNLEVITEQIAVSDQ